MKWPHPAARPAGPLLLFALALTFCAYLPALDAGFVFDDLPNITEAPALHWTSWSAESFRRLVSEPLNPRRAVASFSFALNHLAGGLAPRGYHLVNVMLHLAMGLALAWLVLLVLEGTVVGRPEGPAAAADRSGRALAAAAAALLFLVHPLQTQAVTYVVQRMTLLAALFCLFAFAAYVKARAAAGRRRWIWGGLALGCWLLALGSKENAVLLPLVVATFELCFHRRQWRRAWRAASPRRRRLWGGAVGIAVVLGAVLAVVAVRSLAASGLLGWSRPFPETAFGGGGFSGLERVLTQGRVQLFYLGLLLWPSPSRLNLEHDFAVSRSLFEPATFAALAVCLVILVAAVVLAVRRPRWGFPLLAYLELHLLEAGPFDLDLAFEHRMYLPLAFLAMLPAVGLAELAERGERRGFARAVAVAVALSLALAGATWARNRTWADPVAFHLDCAAKAPEKFRPQYNLGTILGMNGRIAEAIPPLERAVALEPEHSEARNQLANALLLSGRREAALAQYREAVRLDPDNVAAVYNLAVLFDQRGAAAEAVTYYRRFVELAPPGLAARVAQVRARLAQLGG